MPLARRQRPVHEDVTEVAIAPPALDLDAHHAVAAIRLGRDVFIGDRLEEARPARTRIELRVRCEQRQPAADARVDAGLLVVEQRPAKRPFSALGARDRKLPRRQLRLPLGVGFFNARQFERPGQMPNLNNEGFTLTPLAECANNLRPVFWSDDSETNGHSIRKGTVKCSPL